MHGHPVNDGSGPHPWQGSSFFTYFRKVQHGVTARPPWICISPPGGADVLACVQEGVGVKENRQVLTWWLACGGSGGGSTAWRPESQERAAESQITPTPSKQDQQKTNLWSIKRYPGAIELQQPFQNHRTSGGRGKHLDWVASGWVFCLKIMFSTWGHKRVHTSP